jgi:hypothetical protein
MMKFSRKCVTALGSLGLLFVVCAWAAAQEETPPAEAAKPRAVAPTAEQIAAWIAELDSNRYRVRERATQALVEAVPAAGDALLGPLLAAANGDRPEPADRAVWIMRQSARIEDLDLRQRVLEHLVQVEDRPQVVAEARAALAAIRHDFAVREIERLGGRFREAGVDNRWDQVIPFRHVTLDDAWRGGDAGMDRLAELNETPLVIVIGTDVTADGFARLAKMQSLQYLRLYGTRLTAQELAALQQQIPGVQIDFRRGGFLGVQGEANQASAVVATVQPDTAAAAAGLRKGDVIRKFNGKAVANFNELTAEIGKHVPGDEVTLEIGREGQTLEMTVKLGKWMSP